MPHKRNPIGCEQVVGLARLIRANAMAALENVALWHERDISHSSVERVILPDSFIALDHMLRRLTKIVAGMVVYPERMMENLGRSRGVVFSGFGAARAGAARRVARTGLRVGAAQRDAVVQRADGEFKELLLADADVMKVLTKADVDRDVRPRRADAERRRDLRSGVWLAEVAESGEEQEAE